MSSLLTITRLLLVSLLFSSRVEAATTKKRLIKTPTSTQIPSVSATPTVVPISEASKCSQEGPFTLINVFLDPPVPRKGDKVTLSVFYYAPVEVEDPDIVFAFQIEDKNFIHKSSLCENKLTKQELHNRHLDEEQIPQDDNDEIIGLKRGSIAAWRDDNTGETPPQTDNTDIQPTPTCRIRAGEHMDNIDLTWLFSTSLPLDVTMIYGHEKTPLLCAKVSLKQQKNALRH